MIYIMAAVALISSLAFPATISFIVLDQLLVGDEARPFV
jgi:hypothetical protein